MAREERWIQGTMGEGTVSVWVNLPKMDIIGVYGTPHMNGTFGPPWCVKAYRGDEMSEPAGLADGFGNEEDAIEAMNAIVEG